MPEIQISKEKAAALYRTMKLIRCFEESVKRDYLNKELPGFVHLYIGEEAIAAGVCAARLASGARYCGYHTMPTRKSKESCEEGRRFLADVF